MKNIFKCIGWSILYFVITFVVQFGFMMIGIANGIENEEMLNKFVINNNLLLTIVSNIVAIIIFGIVWNRKKGKLKEIKENDIENTKKRYVFLVLIAFLYSILFLIITYNISFEGTKDMITSSILIVAPIGEELLCRGIMINELNKKFSMNKSIVITAVIFGIMHLIAGGLILAIGAIIMGVILGIVYNTTKSLRSAIVVHSIANFSDIILLFIGKINSNTLIVFSILIAITLMCLLLLYQNNKKAQM